MNSKNGWKYIKVSELFDEVSEKNHPDADVLTIIQGVGTVLRTDSGRDILYDKNSLSNYKFVKKGDFIIHLRSFEGGLEIANQDGIVSPAYIILRPKLPTATNYLYTVFHSNRFINQTMAPAVEGVRDGRSVKYEVLKERSIPFPPLAEQEKIAQILTKQDEVISLKEKLLEQKQQQKKWLMQKLLVVPHENSECTEKLSISGVVINKNEWKKEKLGNICDVKGGKRIPKGYQLQSMNNGYPYITVSDMKNGTVFLKGISYVPIEVVKGISQYTISKDDIYISVAGTLGEVGTIPAELDGANLTENADKLTNIKCNKQFLLFLMQSNVVQNQIENSKTNNAQPKLAIEQIKQFDFFLPTLPEQKIIAQVLSAADKEIDLLKQEIEFQKQKKKALAQQLLFGKARVKT